MDGNAGSEILTKAWNESTHTWETIEREPGTWDKLVNAELSAADLGCPAGTEYLLTLVDGEDKVLDERQVMAR